MTHTLSILKRISLALSALVFCTGGFAHAGTPSKAFTSKFTVEIAHMLLSENLDAENVNRMQLSLGLSLTTGDRFYVLSFIRSDGMGRAVQRHFYFLDPDLLRRPVEDVAHTLVPNHLRSGNLMREDGRALWGNLSTDGRTTMGSQILLSDGRILEVLASPVSNRLGVQSDFLESRVPEAKRSAYQSFFDQAARPELLPSENIGAQLSEVTRVKRFFEGAEHRNQEKIRRQLTDIEKNPPRPNLSNVVAIETKRTVAPMVTPVAEAAAPAVVTCEGLFRVSF